MMKVEKIVFEGKNRLMYIYAAILISEFITGVIRGVTSIAAGNTIYGAFILAASALFITSDSFLALQLFGKSAAPRRSCSLHISPHRPYLH